METIDIPTGSAEYSEQGDSGQRVAAKLDGPQSFVRTNVLNGARLVNVSWRCTPAQYEHMRLRARQNSARGGPPFLLPLVLNDPTPAEYKAKFVPGSFKLSGQDGITFDVTAQMWAMPTSLDVPAPSNESDAAYPEPP